MLPTYYPYRALKSRPYYDEAMEMAKKEQQVDLVSLALERMSQVYGSDSGSPLAVASQSNEGWFLSVAAGFHLRGKVVFQIEPTLKEAFRTSDLGDATLEDLSFPHNDFYLHLGEDVGLTFNQGATKLEGVFVSWNPESKGLTLTLAGNLVQEPKHWGERGLETFTMFFESGQAGMLLLDAAREHLKAERIDIDEVLTTREVPERLKGQVDELKDEFKEALEHEKDVRLSNTDTVLECVRLIANALLYIAAYPEDAVPGFQDDFPKGFREKIERSEGKVRERTIAKARSAGYNLITRVGTVFEDELKKEGGLSAGGNHGGKAPHLRRAHWRRQVYGPRNSLRKMIWVRVTRILGGADRERPYLIG